MKKIFLTILCLYFTTIKFTLAFDVKVRQAILMDYDTGEILFQKNANDRVYPSSMTKIMTTYIIFEKLKNGRLFLTDKILISNNAWKQEGSRMFLDIGSNVSIEELLKGAIVQSGNDASYALAEGTAGTVYEFVNLMNQKAKEMGLENTNFTNPIGFTENNHYMSVKDTAILSKRLIQDFPEYYAQYFAIPEYKYNKITQQNRNELLKTYEGADGIKTGHTEAAGYSLAASAYRNNRRLIAVINGANTKKDRIEESKNLLNYGFSILTKYTFYKAGEVIKEIPIFYGKEKKVNIISMSLGRTEETPLIYQAIKKAVSNNILVVCAAGNEGDSNGDTEELSYPAVYSECISVGAVDYSKNIARFTNSNKSVDLVAPGVSIMSTYPNNKYANLQGTSMATPHVSGALALIINWSRKDFGREMSETELYAQLIRHTASLGFKKTLVGNGLLYLLAPQILENYISQASILKL